MSLQAGSEFWRATRLHKNHLAVRYSTVNISNFAKSPPSGADGKLQSTLGFHHHLASRSEEALVLNLCRQHRWKEAALRAQSYPHEVVNLSGWKSLFTDEGGLTKTATQISINSDTVERGFDTALALACRHSKFELQQRGRENVTVDVVRSLWQACPDQIMLMQRGRGTPIHEAINGDAPADILKFLIDTTATKSSESTSPRAISLITSSTRQLANQLGDTEQKTPHKKRTSDGEEIRTPQRKNEDGTSDVRCGALLIKNEIGETALDLLLKKIRLVEPSETIFEMVQHIAENYPNVLDNNGINPLIVFLGVLNRNESAEIACRTRRISEVLLRACSKLAMMASIQTGNLPVHAALLYHGTNAELVKAILDADSSKGSLATKNFRGEVALHVAAMAGLPNDTFRLILEATPTHLFHEKDTRNLSPLKLAWIKRINSEFGQRQWTLRDAELKIAGILLDEATDDVQGLIDAYSETNTTGRSINDIANDSVSYVMGSFWDKVILLLHEQERRKSTSARPFRLLHAVCDACDSLPRALLKIAIMMDPEQAKERDEQGRLPLHIAAARPHSPWWYDPSDNRYEKRSKTVVTESTMRPYHLYGQSVVEILLENCPAAAAAADRHMFLPLHFAIQCEKVFGTEGSHSSITLLKNAFPDGLERRDPANYLLPAFSAAIGENTSIDTTYELLKAAPSAVASGASATRKLT